MRQIFEFDDIRVEPHTFRVWKGGRPVDIEPRAFDLLLALLRSPGELLERDALIDVVWEGAFVTPNVLTRGIAQLRRALGDDPRKPRYIETVHTRGYRCIANIAASPAPPATATEPTSRASSLDVAPVPARLTRLIGRENELRCIGRALQVSRLLTLIGPGGVGKTRLGIEAAGRVASAFPDGVAFVDLAVCTTPAEVPRTVATALDVGGHMDATVTSIGRALRDRELLIVLDNCDHVAEVAGSLAGSLLQTCPQLRVLATSQQPLRVAGESLLRVLPLALPPPDWTDAAAAPLMAFAAVDLFIARARGVDASFSLSPATANAVVDICRRLDGMPLALELAAARLNVLSVQQIAARLDDRFRLLTTGSAPLPRHRTLTATVEWSYNLLSTTEQSLLNRLSVFCGGCRLDAVEAVGQSLEPAAGGSLDALSGLIDRSLVAVEPETEPRYHLLETIRQFSSDRLRDHGQETDARDRHLEHFIDVAARADTELLGPAQSAWLKYLHADYGNFTAAFGWALSDPSRVPKALELVAGLRWYWWRRSQFVEGCDWLSRALDRTHSSPAIVRSRVLIAAGLMKQYLSRFDDARRDLEESLTIEVGSDATWRQLFALSVLTVIAAAQGQTRRAAELGAVARSRAAAEGDNWLRGFALVASGLEAGYSRGHREAAVFFEHAAVQLETCGDLWLLAYATTHHALQRHLLGEHEKAAALLPTSLRIARALDDRRAVAACLETYAYVSTAVGEMELAARLMTAGEIIRTATGIPLAPHWVEAHDRNDRLVTQALGETATAVRAAARNDSIDQLTEDVLRRLGGAQAP